MILRRAQAHKEWKWLAEMPTIRMRKLENKRIRWLTREEARRLLRELPPHLRDMVMFTLLTGLRKSNVTGLQWKNIDMEQQHAFIDAEHSKNKRAIPVPLNQAAIEILNRQKGKHPTHVFVYKGKPIFWCSNNAWRKALLRAKIDNFHWHDLRHTWASWHVQNGTSLQQLQALGGWASFEMVLRYAHLSSRHLQEAAEHVNVTNLSQTTDLG